VGEADETPQAPPPDRPALSRSFIVGLRIILLLASMGAVVAAVAIGLAGRAGSESGTRYACPMHPEVRAQRPGECPICGMALEPVGREANVGASHHVEMAGMPDITAVENIRKHRIIDFVRRRSLLSQLREMRGPAWVDDDGALTAIFYNDQIQSLAADEPGAFSLARAPQTTIAVRRTSDAAVARDRSTSLIRFRLVDGPAAPSARARGGLAPGQVGWIELERKSREVLSVAASAILQSPEGPYVLALIPGGRFEKRPVELGETFLKQGFAVVLSGLRDHDRVVSRAAFFLDADRRLGGREDATQDPAREDPKAEMKAAP
jgi:hypothetical protein